MMGFNVLTTSHTSYNSVTQSNHINTNSYQSASTAGNTEILMVQGLGMESIETAEAHYGIVAIDNRGTT